MAKKEGGRRNCPIIERTLSPTLPAQAPEKPIPHPAEEMALLRDLAQKGFLADILERVAIIQSLGPEFQPFAQPLQALAQSFQVKELRAFIAECSQYDQCE